MAYDISGFGNRGFDRAKLSKSVCLHVEKGSVDETQVSVVDCS